MNTWKENNTLRESYSEAEVKDLADQIYDSLKAQGVGNNDEENYWAVGTIGYTDAHELTEENNDKELREYAEECAECLFETGELGMWIGFGRWVNYDEDYNEVENPEDATNSDWEECNLGFKCEDFKLDDYLKYGYDEVFQSHFDNIARNCN